MSILPLGCLVVRTHFGDDDAWNRLKAAVKEPDDTGYAANVTFVDDRAFDGLVPEALKRQSPEDPDGAMISFIADRRAQADAGCPLVAVWLMPRDPALDESEYEPFRVAASQLASVEVNINLANLDWDDFAGSVGDDGVFRGFG